MNKLRVGIVGAGKRVNYLYCPLVRLLKDDLDLVGICSRRIDSAQAIAGPDQVPAFGDVDKLVDGEQWEHAVLSFANGARGIFDWTSIGYGSAIRWQRSTRFLATKGMALGDELVAHTDPPVYWRNPFSQYDMDDGMIAEASCLMSLVEAVRSGNHPEYGPENARTDQEVYAALRRSADRDGAPVDLPL